MYVICGATGNIGGKITNMLLNAGKEVRVISRSRERLQTFIDRGAEPWVGSLEDTGFLTKAFTGATAVFAMEPPNLQADDYRTYTNKIGTSISTAIEKSGVKQVVNLSSIGAHLSERTGVVLALHDQEERLNKIKGINVVHLRPSYFMENLLMTMPMIKEQNIIGSAIKPDLKFAVVSTIDVADVAAKYLLSSDFTGHEVRNILGPGEITFNEITSVIGKAIGKTNLSYRQFPYSEVEGTMIDQGISNSVASALTEYLHAMNDGAVWSDSKRTPESTTPTTIENFASTFATLYKK